MGVYSLMPGGHNGNPGEEEANVLPFHVASQMWRCHRSHIDFGNGITGSCRAHFRRDRRLFDCSQSKRRLVIWSNADLGRKFQPAACWFLRSSDGMEQHWDIIRSIWE